MASMLESYRWLDLICPISFFVAFLASALFGRKVWSMVDCSASFVFGLGLILAPEIVLDFQITGGKLDEVHTYLLRQIGALLIGQAVSLFLCRNSVDARMYGNVFYSRIFCSLLLLLGQSYSAYHLWDRKNLHFNAKFLLFACSGVGFWMLGSLVQLIRYKQIGGFIQKTSYISVGFIIDHFVLLILAIVLFAFPTQIMKVMIKDKTIDGVHVCFLRTIAAFMVGHALISNSAPGFLYTLDQRSHLIGRLTTQVLTFTINIFGHFVTDIFTLYHVTPFMMTGFYITFLLTVFFRFNTEKSTVMSDWKLRSANSMTNSVSESHSTKTKTSNLQDYSLDDIDHEDAEVDNGVVHARPDGVDVDSKKQK